jgi:hypothetical protein
MNVTAVQTLQFLPAARPQALEGANYAGGTSIFRNALRSGVANVRRATVACALIVSAQRVAGQCRTNHCRYLIQLESDNPFQAASGLRNG